MASSLSISLTELPFWNSGSSFLHVAVIAVILGRCVHALRESDSAAAGGALVACGGDVF
jgi:hypothetical protein